MAFQPVALPNGNLLVPERIEDEETGAIGDTMVEITPDDPDFQAWRDSLSV